MGDITSFKDYITNGLKDEIYDFTNNGICSSCGNCCSHLLPMNKQEVDRIKKYIKSNHIGEIKHLTPLAASPIDYTCPFRDDKNKICTIYEVRPKICRLFLCNNSKKAKENRDKFSNSMKIINVRKEFFK